MLHSRNGRPQACDPCRSRKVACDHTQPICLRCRKRKQPDKCVYTNGQDQTRPASASIHQFGARSSESSPGRGQRPLQIAPEASPPGSASASSSLRPSVSRAIRVGNQNASSTTVTMPSSLSALPTIVSSTPPASSGRPRRLCLVSNARSSVPGSGYLGFTSHETVYDEARTSLSRLHGAQSWSLPNLGDRTQGPQSPLNAIPSILSLPVREMCLVVLRNLPDLTSKDIAPHCSPQSSDGWVRLAARLVLRSIQTHIGSLRSDSEIEELAQLLRNNATKSVSDDIPEATQWISQFVWPDLRWESLGLLFSITDIFVEPSDPQQGSGYNDLTHSSWKQTALVCLGLCIELAQTFSGGNLLILFLCFRRTIMESMATGDASLASIKSHAESVSLLTFMGVHADKDSPTYTPTFCSELRRRLFTQIFIIDKISVSFSGRPPMLSRRFCSTPLPLDIPDDDIFSTEVMLLHAVEKLDENGWRTESQTAHAASVIRARAGFAYLEDEIQEIALATNRHVGIETLFDLKERENACFARLPRFLIHRPEDLNAETFVLETCFSRILILVQHLQNLFFIERLLIRSGLPDNGELLLVSFQMVALTVTFWTHKDIFADIRADFEWLVMSYAAPGGGILCLELLKPSFSGRHPRNPEVTRSAIIQNLSLLVGFLSWVSPDAPNSDLCINCKTVIQHVLDQALNSAPEYNEPFQAMDQFDATQLYFNFDLLNTFDWLRPDDMINNVL